MMKEISPELVELVGCEWARLFADENDVEEM